MVTLRKGVVVVSYLKSKPYLPSEGAEFLAYMDSVISGVTELKAEGRVPSDHGVDSLLALLCGYFLERRDEPTPYSSPYLRHHQDWCAEVSWAWLAQRRGWD